MIRRLRVFRIWLYGKYSLLKKIEIRVRYARGQKHFQRLANEGFIEVFEEMKFPKPKVLD